MDMNHLISVVVPVYNEEEALPLFYKQLRETLDTMTVQRTKPEN